MAGITNRAGEAYTSTNDLLNHLLTHYNGNSGGFEFADIPLSANIDQLIRDWDVYIDTTGVVKAAIIISLHRTPTFLNCRTGAHDDAITMVTEVAAGESGRDIVGSSADVNAIQAKKRGVFLKEVINAVPDAKTWILNLVAANQIRRLTPKNIEGYFMGKNSTKVIGRDLIKLVDIASNKLPSIMSDNSLRTTVLSDNNNWVKYHTTATSTPSLTQKCIQALRPTFPNMFSQATISIVNNAVANFWDKAASDLIPRNAVAVTYVWLRESKQLPDNWYQGNRVYSNTNPILLRRFSSIFKKYLELSVNDTNVKATADADTALGLANL